MSAVIDKPLGAKFLSSLRVELCDDAPGQWELVHPLVYRSIVAKETFVVPVGFRTDFASVPRLPFAFVLFGDVAQEAAVVHDFLYSTRAVSRKMADDVLVEAMGITGVAAWRRAPMWLGVRMFGGSHWEDKAPIVTTVASPETRDTPPALPFDYSPPRQ